MPVLKYWVRKHRAPKGALRHEGNACAAMRSFVRKHRAPKGALRLRVEHPCVHFNLVGQKAPSAKRCIKTRRRHCAGWSCRHCVRKHRAPKGALRPNDAGLMPEPVSSVRMHRAPNGALRHLTHLSLLGDLRQSESTDRQKVH